MIKLNAQGEQAPTMRTVQQNGEPVSFVDKLSALAQKAMSRLAGSSYAGGSFSRITKMIPAVMLAVFAFSTAQAQVYSTNFNNLSSPPTSTELQTPNPGPLPTGITSATWTGGSTLSRFDRGSGNYALQMSNGGASNFVLTLQVANGYRLNL